METTSSTCPIDNNASAATTYDPGDLTSDEVQQLLDAGWQQTGNTLFDPQHWRPALAGDTPDFWCYEDELVALTEEACTYANG